MRRSCSAPAVVCAWLAGALLSQGQTLILTDFEGPWRPVSNNPRGAGELPQGWSDNSNWANLSVRHERLLDEGSSYLRTTVSSLETGWGQLQHSLPRVSEQAYYRLRVRVRSEDLLGATFGIRRGGAPYNYLWQVRTAPGPNWRYFTFYARLSPADYDVAFYVALSGAGSYDLSAFHLEKLSEQELLDEFSRNAAGLPKNLFRNTRFPLGLPAGWMLDRDSSDTDAVTLDVEDKALRIQGAKRWQITTEPFAVPKPRTPYTASFRARGTASGRLQVISDGAVLATRNYQGTPDGERLSITFNSPVLVRAQALRLEGTGELVVEDFQLEEGTSATEFSPPACELHLSTASPLRLGFDDEPLSVTYSTLGGEVCASVRLKAETLAGDSIDLPVESSSGEADLPAAYGAYRVEGWVENASGERVSPYQEITVYRLRRPRYWMEDAPASPFGIHTNSTTRHILMAKAIGLNWTRLHDAGLQYIGWYHLERKPGEWTFYDDDIRRYRQYGMKVLGLLSTAPEWASHFDRPRNGYFDRFYQPRDLGQFANYVRTVTERYRDLIDTWDVWNEPWNAGWWAVRYDDDAKRYVTSEQPHSDFARLHRVAWDTAKSVAPSLTILGINSTTGSTGSDWTRGVVAAGGLDTSDVLCYHQYTTEPLGFARDAAERGWRDAVEPAMTGGGLDRPAWMTEGSPVYGLSGPGFYRRLLPFTDTENYSFTGDRIVRHVVSLLAQGVGKVFLYSMHSHESIAGPENVWRVILGEDGYLHPSAAAHSTMAWFLEDTRFVSRIEPAPGLTAFIFEGSGRSVAVLAPKQGSGADWTPPGDTPRFDLYGNSVQPGAAAGRYVSYLEHPGDAPSLVALLKPE